MEDQEGNFTRGGRSILEETINIYPSILSFFISIYSPPNLNLSHGATQIDEE